MTKKIEVEEDFSEPTSITMTGQTVSLEVSYDDESVSMAMTGPVKMMQEVVATAQEAAMELIHRETLGKKRK